jgi:hypothetical protein
MNNSALFGVYLAVVFLLLFQYFLLWIKKVLSYNLFYKDGDKASKWIAGGALTAFLCNLCSISVAYSESTPDLRELEAVLLFQILYYTIQWSYVPNLIIMAHVGDITALVRCITVVLLFVCAGLQIATLVYLVVISRQEKTDAWAWGLQIFPVIWTGGFDFLAYSRTKYSFSMPFEAQYEAQPKPKKSKDARISLL